MLLCNAALPCGGLSSARMTLLGLSAPGKPLIAGVGTPGKPLTAGVGTPGTLFELSAREKLSTAVSVLQEEKGYLFELNIPPTVTKLNPRGKRIPLISSNKNYSYNKIFRNLIKRHLMPHFCMKIKINNLLFISSSGPYKIVIKR